MTRMNETVIELSLLVSYRIECEIGISIAESTQNYQNYICIASSDVILARRISVLHEAQKNLATLVCKNDTGSRGKLCVNAMRQRVVPQIRCVRIFGCSSHRSIFISRMSIHHLIQTISPCVSQEN